jgi:hypothetical protein
MLPPELVALTIIKSIWRPVLSGWFDCATNGFPPAFFTVKIVISRYIYLIPPLKVGLIGALVAFTPCCWRKAVATSATDKCYQSRSLLLH